MTVEIMLEEASGEPLLNGRMRWEAGPNTGQDCLAPGTVIYLKVGGSRDENHYVRFDPEVRLAGAGYGKKVNFSPNWNEIFCSAPRRDASCLGAEQAKALFAAKLEVRWFDVVTQSTAVSARNTSSSRRNKTTFDIDGRLEEAMAARADEYEVEEAGEPKEPEEPEEPTAQMRSPTYDFAKTPEEASRNIIGLLASSLARYETPPNDCESSRQVTNWVLAGGDVCELVFRSEAKHTFTCTDDGRPDQILRTERAEVDFATDVDYVSDPRVSTDGWIALVMKFTSPLTKSAGDGIKADRWQFAASTNRTAEMQALTANLHALKSLCGDAS
jgi:hypothetical protein